jgi:hypothetical protein
MKRQGIAGVLALALLSLLVIPATPASGTTVFCNGVDTWDPPHMSANIKFKVCITYVQFAGSFQLTGSTSAYFDACSGACQDHVDTFHVAQKLEKPLGTVTDSHPCQTQNEPIGSGDSFFCQVQRTAADPPSFFSTTRITIFFTDGHSINQSFKLCQRGTGPDDTPTSC